MSQQIIETQECPFIIDKVSEGFVFLDLGLGPRFRSKTVLRILAKTTKIIL